MAIQQAIGLASVGLVVADNWENRAALLAPVKGGSSIDTATLKTLGLQVLGVIIVTVISGVSSQWAAVMGVLVFILWVLFLIGRSTKGAKS